MTPYDFSSPTIQTTSTTYSGGPARSNFSESIQQPAPEPEPPTDAEILQGELCAVQWELESLQHRLAEAERARAELQLARDEISLLKSERQELRDLAADLQLSVNSWTESAHQYMNNSQYYRGLLHKIGASFGHEAQIADDGTDMQEVLVAKVPQLVQAVQLRLWQAQQQLREYLPLTEETPDDGQDTRQRVIALDPAR